LSFSQIFDFSSLTRNTNLYLIEIKQMKSNINLPSINNIGRLRKNKDMVFAMFFQLMVGSVVICITIAIEGMFILAATSALPHMAQWLEVGHRPFKSALTLIGATLWLLLAHSIAVWAWAVTYLWLEAFDTLEPALYFSIVSFTTLGFGDIILPVETRLLSGLAAANGLIAFGLSTAFLVEFIIRLRRAHVGHEPI